jgi:hypothetical protein
MNDQLLNQFDMVENQLVEIYRTIKSEMRYHLTDQGGDEYRALYDQLVIVKGLLHTVRNTLRESAPELYPDY